MDLTTAIAAVGTWVSGLTGTIVELAPYLITFYFGKATIAFLTRKFG